MLKRIYIHNLNENNPIKMFIPYLNWIEDKDYFCYSHQGLGTRSKASHLVKKVVDFDSFFHKLDKDILKHTKVGNGVGIYLFVNKSNLEKGTITGSNRKEGFASGAGPLEDSENVYYVGSSVDLRDRIRYHLKYGKTHLSKDIQSGDFEFDLYVLLLNRVTRLYVRRIEFELVNSLIRDKSIELNCAKGRWNSWSFSNLIKDKSFLAKSKLDLPFSEVKGNTLYNKRFPSTSYIKCQLAKKLYDRVSSIYSCGFCKDSGNYFKSRKFANIKEAGNHYNLSLKSIRSSIKAGSLPCNFKLNGLGVNTKFKDSVEKIYFFELEKGRFGRPVICYTEADFFVGYFNSVSSAQSFLELDKKVVNWFH